MKKIKEGDRFVAWWRKEWYWRQMKLELYPSPIWEEWLKGKGN